MTCPRSSRFLSRSLSGVLILSAITATPAGAQQSTWTIDPGHSRLGFRVRHLMVATIRGHFASFTGSVVIDPADTTRSSVTVEIASASVTSGNTRRDNAVRSGDFLSVDQFPTLTFRSTSVERIAAGWRAIGNLTIKGITRSVMIPFTFAVAADGKLLGVSGSLTINREDYGMTAVPAATVGNEVHIEIDIEATPASPRGAP
jgi:polyisoprenoid-binding protein YceI